MPFNSSEVLRHLFAIPQSQIRREISEGGRDNNRLMREDYAKYLAEQETRLQDPQVAALAHHRRLVRAKVINGNENLVPEYRLFCASMAATDVANEAIIVAQDRGRLAGLRQRIKEIKQREGLAEDEYWPVGAGPVDFQQVRNESDELYESVYDTIYTTILRRYELDEVARMHEDDRAEHDELRERGCKLAFDVARSVPS